MGASWFASARRALWLWLLLVLSAPALAQSLPDRFKGTKVVARVGDEVVIHFANSSMANKTVTINVTDGENNVFPASIKLNGKGVGTRKLSIPNWDVVLLEHPSSFSHVIFVRS